MRILHAALAWIVLAAVFCGATPAQVAYVDGPSLLCVAFDDLDTDLPDEPAVRPECAVPSLPVVTVIDVELLQSQHTPRSHDVLCRAPKTSPPNA